jgi:hypothetical protein
LFILGYRDKIHVIDQSCRVIMDAIDDDENNDASQARIQEIIQLENATA